MLFSKSIVAINKELNSQFDEIVDSINSYYEMNTISSYKEAETIKLGLSNLLQKLISDTGSILLSRLVNDLTKEAEEKIGKYDTEIKRSFYNLKLRNKIMQSFKYVVEPVLYIKDKSLVKGIWTGSILLTVGLVVTVIVSGTIAAKLLITGLSLVISSSGGYYIYASSSKDIMIDIKKQCCTYVSEVKENMREWLKDVQISYKNEFVNFCKENGLRLEGVS